MSEGRRRRGWRAAPVPSKPLLREVADRFSPPYEISSEAPQRGLRLVDPSGSQPDISIRHRYQRRLFLRANYLQLTSTVRGGGPEEDAELVVRFRGPLSRQRARVAWKASVPGGDEWLAGCRDRLVEEAGGIEAVELMTAAWSAKKQTWRLRVETMSGSMVSGILAALPIAVPFERHEATSFMGLIDVFGSASA